MLIPQTDHYLDVPYGTMRDGFCVYEVQAQFGDPLQFAPTLMYIGCCKLIEIYRMPDLQQNKAWYTRVTNETMIRVSILQIGPHVECYNDMTRRLNAMRVRPPCNDVGMQLKAGGHFIIICIETQQTFKNQSEAARVMNLSQSGISMHLNGQLADVKGFHFERVLS